MHKIRSITKVVLLFAVAALLFSPVPSMGQEELHSEEIVNVSVRKQQTPLAYYKLGDEETLDLTLMTPKDHPPIDILLINEFGENLFEVPITAPENETRYNGGFQVFNIKIHHMTAQGLFLDAPGETDILIRPSTEPPEVGFVVTWDWPLSTINPNMVITFTITRDGTTTASHGVRIPAHFIKEVKVNPSP